jgi:hypothetical protein
MKKLLLLPSLLFVLIASAQTYQKIEVSHFGKEGNITSKTIKYKPGNVKITDKSITVDDKVYTIVRTGSPELQDEGYTATEYLCIAETKSAVKALKIVLLFTPKKQLCDVIVKTGKTSADYCLTDK